MCMRKYLYLAATAAAALATPAAAHDGAFYVGADAGILFPENKDVNGSVDFTNPLRTDIGAVPLGRIRFKEGYDVDVNGGYDLGMFRVEGELAYKHSKVKHFDLNSVYINGINQGSGNAFASG